MKKPWLSECVEYELNMNIGDWRFFRAKQHPFASDFGDF